MRSAQTTPSGASRGALLQAMLRCAAAAGANARGKRVSGASLCVLTRLWCCCTQAAGSRAPWLTPLRPLPLSACLAGASTGAPTRQRGTRFQCALARRRCHRGARSRAAVAARACVRCLRCAPHSAPLGAAQRPARPPDTRFLHARNLGGSRCSRRSCDAVRFRRRRRVDGFRQE